MDRRFLLPRLKYTQTNTCPYTYRYTHMPIHIHMHAHKIHKSIIKILKKYLLSNTTGT